MFCNSTQNAHQTFLQMINFYLIIYLLQGHGQHNHLQSHAVPATGNGTNSSAASNGESVILQKDDSMERQASMSNAAVDSPTANSSNNTIVSTSPQSHTPLNKLHSNVSGVININNSGNHRSPQLRNDASWEEDSAPSQTSSTSG